jgi:DNA-binding transcriptional LysR family regulator
MPRLAALETLLPRHEIVLRPTDRSPDLVRGEADVEIRFGSRSEPGVRSEELATPRFFPVASPAFLAARPAVATAADVAALPLVHEDSREQWRRWLAAAGLDPVPPLEGPRLWYANVAIEAVLLDQGVALVNRLQVGREIAECRLVELLDTAIGLGPYEIRADAARWTDPVVVELRRWLRQEMAASLARDRPASTIAVI